MSTITMLNGFTATAGQHLENASSVNMQVSSADAAKEMNRIISTGAANTNVIASDDDNRDPGFGTHVREAIDIVKQWA